MGHGDVLDSLPAELFDCFVAGEAMPGYFLAYQSLLHRSLRQRGVRPGQGLDHEQLQHPGSKLVVIAGAGHLCNIEASDRFNAEAKGFLRTAAG